MYLYILVNAWYVLIHTQFILSIYSFPLIINLFYWHAHIENIKTVANLSNNKDVFMCILCFHARAGYLQKYETILKEINLHPGSAPVQDNQYQVECLALSDCNFNLACETGTWICYPSLVAMLNCPSMLWHMKVIYYYVHVYTGMYFDQPSTSWCVPSIYSDMFVLNRLTLGIALVV